MKNQLILFISILLLSGKLKSQNLYFPPTVGNVWDSILPSNLNYCQERIDSLYNYLQVKNTKSFILLKDGKRVLEKYFGTYTQDSLWYWASASKSLASFITGLAQQKGYIDINNPVSNYLGTGWTSAPLNKENLITVKHLLSMTSGLNDAPSTPCTNEDTARSCLSYLTDAGTRWAYHTGAYRKVQDIVSHAVGQNYNVITNAWIENRTGMSGLWFQQVYYSKARDMARFGLLNLNKGIWNVDTLLKDHLYFNAMVNTSQSLNNAYGYLWWLNGKSSSMVPGLQIVFPGSLISNAPNDMYAALGKNDQKIYVVPSANLVVVRQGNTAGGFNLASSAFDNVLWDYINKLDCSVTALSEKTESLFNIYPNPVIDFLTIENLNYTIANISVYDIYGMEVEIKFELNYKTLKIDFSKFEKGIYIVEIKDDFKSCMRQKFIKI
jgi:CubicO group peptidase (beta-lactamase class C family)